MRFLKKNMPSYTLCLSKTVRALFLNTGLLVLGFGAQTAVFAQKKDMQVDPSGYIKKYDASFTGIGPQVYIPETPKSKEELLKESYSKKFSFKDSIARELDFQKLLQEFKSTSNAGSIANLLSKLPISKAEWLKLIEQETQAENYDTAYALLNAYAIQALREKSIPEALTLLNNALAHAKQQQQPADVANIQYNLGNIYFYLKDLNNAGALQEANYKMAVEQRSLLEQATSLVKIALIQAADKDYNSAENNIIRKAIPLLNKAKAYEQKVAAWLALAQIYQWQNKHTEAQWFLIQARDLAVSKGLTADLAEMEYMLAFSKLVQKNYSVAQKEFISADKLAKLEKNKLLQLAILDQLGQAYMENNELPKAADILDSYRSLRLELFKN